MRIFTLFILCMTSFFSSAQVTNWLNISSGWIADNIAFEGDLIWVPTISGLVSINKTTGEQEAVYQPWNSPIIGQEIIVVEIDGNGTKWIGTEDGGLYSFDGQNWETHFDINTGDTMIDVVDIYIAPNGEVWVIAIDNQIASNCRKLFKYDGNTFTRHDQHFPNGNPGSDCNGLLKDLAFTANGDVWVATRFGLYLYDGISQVLLSFDDTNTPLSANEDFERIVVDENGDLWLGTMISSDFNTYYRILRYDGNEWTIERQQTFGWCALLLKDDENNIWFESRKNGGDKDYAKYDGTDWTFYDISDMPNAPDIYDTHDPTLLAIDNDNTLWFEARTDQYEHRLLAYDGQSNWTIYNPKILPIAGPYFSDFLFDCDNNVWLSTSRVLNKREGNTWLQFEYPTTGQLRNIALDDQTCKIWAAFADASPNNDPFPYDLVNFDGVEFEGFDLEGYIYFVKINEGIVWVGSSEGLGKYESGNWTWYDETNSPLVDYVARIAFDPQGQMWLIDHSESLIRFDGNDTWQVFNSSNSSMTTGPTWVFVDQSGFVWINQFDKLAKYDGTDFEFFDIDPVIEYPHWMDGMVEDHLHNYWIWFGTRGALYWDGTDFTHFNMYNSDMGSTYVKDMKIDPYGNKWMRHINGFSIYHENQISNKYIHPPASVHGTVFFDTALDGLYQDGQDFPLPGKKVLLLPDSTISFTTAGGYYSFYPEQGEYQVQHLPEPTFISTSDSLLAFDLGFYDIDTLDFGTWTDEAEDSIDVGITTGISVCNQLMNVWITLTNHGLSPAEGSLTTTFDEAFSFHGQNPPDGILSGNSVTWAYQNLPFHGSKVFTLQLAVPGVDFIDHWFDFEVEAVALENNAVIASDEDLATSRVVCSYDPNDKSGRSIGENVPPYSKLGDPLEYTIRFQNLGSYTAFDVVIKDTLADELDLSTFRVISSSHPLTTLLEANGALSFRFEGINLPPQDWDELGSQGFVKYYIEPFPDLPDPTTILNTAHIYFDFNPAVVTNTTENILVDSLPTAVKSPEFQTEFLVYPNPSNAEIWIEWIIPDLLSGPWKLIVIDITGRIVRQEETISSLLSVADLDQGIYFFRIERGKVFEMKKVVVIR